MSDDASDYVPGSQPLAGLDMISTPAGLRHSTADRALLEQVADHPGSTMDEIRERMNVTRWRQGHFALSLKDARAGGLIERVEVRKGDPFAFEITEAGLRALGRA